MSSNGTLSGHRFDRAPLRRGVGVAPLAWRLQGIAARTEHKSSTPHQPRFVSAGFFGTRGGRKGGGGDQVASIQNRQAFHFCLCGHFVKHNCRRGTLQTVINHKLWAMLKCLPPNLPARRKSEMPLIGFQQLSPFLAQTYLIWLLDNAVDCFPERSPRASCCASLDGRINKQKGGQGAGGTHTPSRQQALVSTRNAATQQHN